jgi:extracellular elastinolytic metalloproteinase
MKARRVSLVLVALFFGITHTAEAQGRAALDRPARITRGAGGAALTPPSTASARAVVARFLRQQGADPAVAESIADVAEGEARIRHVRFEQRVAGLPVYGSYVKAAVNDRGELTHLIENLAPVPPRLGQARINGQQAIAAAIRHLYPAYATIPPGFFYRTPSASRVVVPYEDGAMRVGFLVETWTNRGNLLHYTLVDGDGAILKSELRTNDDRYNIFPIHPGATPQQVVSGPGAGNAESPAGWVFAGAQSSVDAAGNNVHAYLDRNNDGLADAGGMPVVDGEFLTTADLTAEPTIAGNQNVSVQNLFYLNNLIHDTLYRHGFTEGAGNFQEDNFGRRGRDADSVRAEAQDGGGIHNANFATPVDGFKPRMQMYLFPLWMGSHQVTVNSPRSQTATYSASGAFFGPRLDSAGIIGDIVLALDGAGSATDACEPIANTVSGRIALIDRGTCTFVVKVKNAQNAGAVGVVIANNQGDTTFAMGGSDETITIPSVMVGRTDGQALRQQRGPAPVNVTVARGLPARDSAVDADIVWHEYGHGLTWRMIGNMSGPLSGAIGEGMSDVLAIVMTENDRIAEYSEGTPLGFRSAPYTNYPRTYGDVAGSGVHFDGEVYAAIGWRLWEIFQANGLSKDLLLDYIVDGMNYTPSGPSYEQMRDGILQAAAARGLGHECLIWQAFARYGVGVGALGRAQGSTVRVAESFALPAQCATTTP